MSETNRRSAIATVLFAGAAISTSNKTANAQEEALTKDQEFVTSAGLTKEEADCWKKTAEAAGAFFKLPELHQMDKQEVASAIHIIQNKLLGRPTYRKYLELAKAAGQKQD
ncbi:MAG TPA: hypothetical protein DDW52_12855 [Planctomycetaceae bacterium]|nr:hypothetical protein [Planctomycetaceae bacterium]